MIKLKRKIWLKVLVFMQHFETFLIALVHSSLSVASVADRLRQCTTAPEFPGTNPTPYVILLLFVFLVQIKLRKGKDLRKHGKTAASVLLTLIISGNESLPHH